MSGERPRALSPEEARACERARAGAVDARRIHDWAAVLRNTAEPRCWEDEAARRILRVRALLESGDYAGCVDAGRGSSDREVRRLVELCVSRGAS